MSNLTFHDISQFQGSYNMAADPNLVIAMRMSFAYYGSKVLGYDPQASRNYRNSIRTGKVPVLYHFAGGGDPVKEADFFVGAISPLADGDIYALDYELTASMNPPSDPVNWCLQFVERVHQKTGVWPLLYTYSSMLAEHDFSPVLKLCGLWVADYAVSPDGTVPTAGHPYIIHQYTSKPLDTNALFMPLDTFKRYAFHSSAPAPASNVTVPSPSPLGVPTAPETAPATGAAGSVTTSGLEQPPTVPPGTNVPITGPPPVTVVSNPGNTPKSDVLFITNFFRGKKSYIMGLLMFGTAVEKYVTGDTTLSQFLTTVQGILGFNGLAVMTLRAAIATVERKL